jgi:hypothetical protein
MGRGAVIGIATAYQRGVSERRCIATGTRLAPTLVESRANSARVASFRGSSTYRLEGWRTRVRPPPGLGMESDMAEYDRPRDTTVVHTDGGGNGGLYAVLIVVVILLVAGFIWFSGGFGSREMDNSPDIELNIPQPDAPDVDVDMPDAPDVDVETR